MAHEAILRIRRPDLERLLASLEVRFVKLAECLVTPGWRLVLDPVDSLGLHYNISGAGRMLVEGASPIELAPHMLVVVPRGRQFVLEAVDGRRPVAPEHTVEQSLLSLAPGEMLRLVAGDAAADPRVMLICGYFDASFATAIQLFSNLASPVVERFDASDELDIKLKSALAELVEQEVGAGAMTAALLKQVLVMLLRRALSSTGEWVERFSLLKDPQVARAFSLMAGAPGGEHSLQSLSKEAGLSRSLFVTRFTDAFGRPPMTVLRELRMRQAAGLLAANARSIEGVAAEVGYKNRSSFMRAFRRAYGVEPSEYRAARHDDAAAA